MLKVAMVGDVAGVAAALTGLLDGHADVIQLAYRQWGASFPEPLKVLASPFRLLEAGRLAWRIRQLRPDIVHVHWVPNGLAGVLSGRPFILHAHGDDVRALGRIRGPISRWLLRRAALVVYSTPDLGKWVHGIWLPNPVGGVDRVPQTGDIFVASRDGPSKGRALSFAGVRLLPAGVRVSILAGGDVPEDLQHLEVEQLQHDPFVRRMASFKVVWGQLSIGSLGLTELEAMRAGCAVAAWVSPDVMEVYGEPVPAVVTRDAADLAASAVELLADESRRGTLAAAGADWAARHHGLDAVRIQLLAIYGQMREG